MCHYRLHGGLWPHSQILTLNCGNTLKRPWRGGVVRARRRTRRLRSFRGESGRIVSLRPVPTGWLPRRPRPGRKDDRARARGASLMAACWRSAGTGQIVPPAGCCRAATSIPETRAWKSRSAGRSARRAPAGWEQIPLTAAGLGAIDLKPAAVAGLLRDAVAAGRDLSTLPDLRSGPALRMGGSGVVRCRP